jgi:Zn-dependent protease with chaperone function
MPTEDAEFSRPQEIAVERWPSEDYLFAFFILAALNVWFVLAISIFGAIYALFIGIALFFAHLLFVTHVRGSAVRLGPNQLPELYHRVHELAARAGLDPVPEAYVMQAGGSLNALATRFLRSRIIVLFSDLLDACGDDHAARDMVIGHELGHHKAGHLRFTWLLAPGWLVPFLGAAYSRAREYTCDRWGAALCGERRGALRGLAILAAGGRHGRDVNLEEFARQRTHLDTGWMTLGKWLSTYPPLCDRVAALEPGLVAGQPALRRGPVRALSLLGCVFLVPVAGAVAGFAALLPKYLEIFEALDSADTEWSAPAPAEERPPVDVGAATVQVNEDFGRLSGLLEEHYRIHGALPADGDELYAAWSALRPGAAEPADPFDGLRYGYWADEASYSFWSSGPDGDAQTDDDIEFEGAVGGGGG